jgi:hypothetical protein
LSIKRGSGSPSQIFSTLKVNVARSSMEDIPAGKQSVVDSDRNSASRYSIKVSKPDHLASRIMLQDSPEPIAKKVPQREHPATLKARDASAPEPLGQQLNQESLPRIALAEDDETSPPKMGATNRTY